MSRAPLNWGCHRFRTAERRSGTRVSVKKNLKSCIPLINYKDLPVAGLPCLGLLGKNQYETTILTAIALKQIFFEQNGPLLPGTLIFVE